jgi:hypothetical protein
VSGQTSEVQAKGYSMSCFACLQDTAFCTIFVRLYPLEAQDVTRPYQMLSKVGPSATSRSQWPRGLRRGSAAAGLLGSWVRIRRGAWMFVLCLMCKDNNTEHKWREERRKDSKVQSGSKEQTGREKMPLSVVNAACCQICAGLAWLVLLLDLFLRKQRKNGNKFTSTFNSLYFMFLHSYMFRPFWAIFRKILW